jgi:hypothetical protein
LRIIALMMLALLPAALSAGPLTAYSVTITTTVATEDDNVFFLGCAVSLPSCNTSDFVVQARNIVGSLGVVTNDLIVNSSIPVNFTSGYAMAIGLDASNTSDVVISLASGITITGTDWNTLFPSTAESTISNDLLTNNFTDLQAFFDANLTDFVAFNSASGEIGEFSTGAVVGSAEATITPEPGALALTAWLLGGLGFAHRRHGIRRRAACDPRPR